MVNKDQLDQTPEGKQVLALLAEHFPADQFQPALTLIEQRYTEDETVWDAELNHDSKLPFLKTHSAHRLLVFFASPFHLAKIKAELAQRATEHPTTPAAAPARKAPAATKPKAKRKTHPKPIAPAHKAHRPKKKTVKPVKKKLLRTKPSKKRSKVKSRPAKAQKSRAKKK